MCGIAGILSRDATEQQLDAMLQRIYHRGPDGDGRHVESGLMLGMRRLSIIDVEHGWQPLSSRGGRVLAFQNGEIYNHAALRRELEGLGYRFETRSDTEVLAHGYDAWGLARLLQRIDGMYAIALYDRDRRKLHLARDRFGEKPLFYMQGRRCLAFASSVKALAVLPWFDRSVDPLALDRYLAMHYVPGERTIFSAVRRLLPGSVMSLDVDNPRAEPRRYYQLPLRQPRAVPLEEISAAVEQAIRSRLVADVPVGVFLSGGIDSSIIAAVAVQENPHISTYSIGFPDSLVDESVHAEAVARHVGSHHQTFHFDSGRFVELLPEVAAALDEPIGDQATLPLFWLCREASKSVTVVLSGEGGDELFGGYSYYRPFAAPAWPGSLSWLLEQRRVQALLEDGETASGFPLLAGPGERAEMLTVRPSGTSSWETDTSAWLDTAHDPLQRACAADVAGWLPDDLLVKLDRIGMAQSLEGRAPFLTPRLADLAINLDPAQRIAGDVTKVALRQVARRLLPADIIDRPKQGFVLPMRRWLKEWFDSRGPVDAYVAQAGFPGLDAAVVGRLIRADVADGVKRERLLFSLVVLIEWWKNFER